MSDTVIGFIGLGNMGGRMTRRLVDNGRQVIGYDTRPGQAAGAGAIPAASVTEVAERADVILLSLPDSRAVEAVVFGPAGILESCRAGQVVVDLSTASPASTAEIHRRFDSKGVAFVDAGISGGAAAAEKGTLTIMAGGGPGVIDSLAPVFAPIAAKVHDMGRSGAGHTAKLLNNFLNAVSLAATAEVMVAAKKAGLDLDVFLEVLNSSSGVNFATLNRFPRIIHGDYLEGGLTNVLMMKDVTLYVDLMGQLGVPPVNASGPLATFGLANNTGYGQLISNRVVDAVGDVAGGIRLSHPRSPANEEK